MARLWEVVVNICLFIIALLSCLSQCRDLEREMTIKVSPGREECFYQDVLAGEVLDVEYQVIDGGQGELDINFYVSSPYGSILAQDVKKGDSNHRTTITEPGDYKICWDNSFSRFNAKVVFFAIMIESENEDEDSESLWGRNFDSSYAAEDVYEMKVEDIKDTVDRIRSHLSKSRFIQDQLRAFESRDRNIAENNFTRVNFMSSISVIAMIITGLTQVVLLRSLFDESSRFNRIWRKENESPYS